MLVIKIILKSSFKIKARESNLLKCPKPTDFEKSALKITVSFLINSILTKLSV